MFNQPHIAKKQLAPHTFMSAYATAGERGREREREREINYALA